MSVNNLNDSVGKKIVEALKMQDSDSDISTENFTQETNLSDLDESLPVDSVSDVNPYNTTAENALNDNFSSIAGGHAQNTLYYGTPTASAVDNAFQRSLENNLGQNNPDFEYPTNVAVLMNLMTKLPTGVSRQTAAVIISQTMEALGIPMSSVIQEAKQVQDSFSARARECQKNIIDFRNQINALELQGQQYQRQVVKINDIISLFTRN